MSREHRTDSQAEDHNVVNKHKSTRGSLAHSRESRQSTVDILTDLRVALVEQLLPHVLLLAESASLLGHLLLIGQVLVEVLDYTAEED